MRMVIRIELEVHYQRFLRHHFGCSSEIFEFPQRNKFNTMLEQWVLPLPEFFSLPDYGEDEFKIMLPALEYGDFEQRYLTVNRQMIFKRKLREYYEWVITERIKFIQDNMRNRLGEQMTREESTLFLIDEFGFDEGDKDSFDRLYKLVSRYNKRELWSRYSGKRKESRHAKRDRQLELAVEVGRVDSETTYRDPDSSLYG